MKFKSIFVISCRRDDLFISEPENKIVPTTPKTTPSRPIFTLNVDENSVPSNSFSSSVIDGDDGSVTIQTVSQTDEGEHVITEKTKLRRSESNTQTEERDLIIESKITSPGGTSNYHKDVTSSRRKLSSRGSDYFSRSKYVIKRTRKDSDEIEEHDVIMETDNFSVTKGESWGDRAEAKVELSCPSNIDKVIMEDNTPQVIKY